MHEKLQTTPLSHYLRTGQKINGFRPENYADHDPCDLCGGTDYDLDLKGVDDERKRRYQELYKQYEVAKVAGKTHKAWQVVGGSKTRQSHRYSDSQIVKIDEKFHIGGEKLFLPNDPIASLNETANCRCSVKYIEKYYTLIDPTTRDAIAARRRYQETQRQDQEERKPVWPTNFNKITDGFFKKPRVRFDGELERPHTGIDIRNYLGGPVYAILPGKVVQIFTARSGNNYIKIKHEDGLESSYSHTKSSVKVGQNVVSGQVIGHSDGSGTSDGRGGLASHLHLVLRRNGDRIDPMMILKIPKK